MEEQIRKLYVEASSRCNLRCKMCFRHSWSGERFGDLDPAVFMRVMDDPVLSAAETVFFGGMGEPLVHPALAEMASLASARGKQVELVTNGTLLTREKVRDLLAAGVSRIWVSIDELYENYGKIQVGSDFGLVLGNLVAFNELRRGTGVRLGMTAVVMRDNIASLRRIREFAEHFLADDLNLSHMIPNRPEDIEQALWPMCDVAAIKAVTDKIGYTWRFEGFDMGTEIPMFMFSKRYKNLLFPDEESLQERSCLPGEAAQTFLRQGVRVISNRDIPVQDQQYLEHGRYGTFLAEADGTLVSLASPCWLWGNLYENIVRSILSGSWKEKKGSPEAVNYWWGMDSGVIDVELSDCAPEGLQALARQLMQDLRERRLDPVRRRIAAQDDSVKNDGTQSFTPWRFSAWTGCATTYRATSRLMTRFCPPRRAWCGSWASTGTRSRRRKKAHFEDTGCGGRRVPRAVGALYKRTAGGQACAGAGQRPSALDHAAAAPPRNAVTGNGPEISRPLACFFADL